MESFKFSSFYLNHFFQEKSSTNGYFHNDNLLSLVSNLFTAGVETISTTLNWSILLMLKYPEIQSKCFYDTCCYTQYIKNWTGTWTVNISVSTLSYKKPRFPANYCLGIAVPCGSDPVRGTLVSLPVDYKQSSYGPGPLLSKISLIKKKRAALCWPMKLFQVSLRNRLLINQRPVQMLNGLYRGFKYLSRFRELLFVWHLHSSLWHSVVRSQVGVVRHLLVRARNFRQKRGQKNPSL